MTGRQGASLATPSKAAAGLSNGRLTSALTGAMLMLAAVSGSTALVGLIIFTVAKLSGRVGYNSQISVFVATAHAVACLIGVGIVSLAAWRGRRVLLHKLVFAVVSGLTILAYFELAAGIWFPRVQQRGSLYVSDSEVGWRMRPDYCTEHLGGLLCTNKEGFRSPSLEYEKSPDQVRVVCLGDSLTFGHGVATRDAYPQQLGYLLRVRFPKRRWEVINAGVEGHSTFQSTAELRRCLKYDPDLAVLLFCLNDVTEKYLVLRAFGGTGLDYHGVVDGSAGRLLTLLVQMRHYSALATALTPSSAEAERKEAYAISRLWEQPFPQHLEEAWSQTERELEELVALCERQGIGLLVAMAPHRAQVTGGAALNAPQKRLERWAQERSVAFMDLLPDLRERSGDGSRASVGRLFLDAGHLTAEGNHIIAAAIVEAFESGIVDTAGASWEEGLRTIRRVGDKPDG